MEPRLAPPSQSGSESGSPTGWAWLAGFRRSGSGGPWPLAVPGPGAMGRPAWLPWPPDPRASLSLCLGLWLFLRVGPSPSFSFHFSLCSLNRRNADRNASPHGPLSSPFPRPVRALRGPAEGGGGCWVPASPRAGAWGAVRPQPCSQAHHCSQQLLWQSGLTPTWFLVSFHLGREERDALDGTQARKKGNSSDKGGSPSPHTPE